MPNVALCRVCLAGDTKMYHIVNTRYQEIFEKLSTKLSTVDRKPETVCYVCLSYLQRCRRFMEMSQKAEMILNHLSRNSIQPTHKNITELNLELRQPLSVTPLQYLYSSDTSQVIVKEEVIDVKIEETNEEELLAETRIDVVNTHDSSDVTATEDVISVKVEETSEEDFLVEMLSDNYETSEGFNIIGECLKFEDDSNDNALSEPLSTDAEQLKLNNIYCCDVCNRAYSVKSRLARHIKQSHTAKHSGKKSYACCICDKKFTFKNNLRRHIFCIHNEIYPYSCDKCIKKFKIKEHLSKHKRIHTIKKNRERLHCCDVCDRKFYIKSTLTAHMAIHTGERPYACHICYKYFNRKGNLDVHMRTHTGEKPFACDICDKRYAVKSSLKAHKRDHIGKKP